MLQIHPVKPELNRFQPSDVTDIAVFVRSSDDNLKSWNRQRIVDLRRNAGLNHELSILSSELCNFMSRPQATLRLPRGYGWATNIPDLAAIQPGKLQGFRGGIVRRGGYMASHSLTFVMRAKASAT